MSAQPAHGGVMSRLADLQYRFLDRMRDRRAAAAADRPGTAADFSGFEGARQCLVVTFKRSGEAVPTPVNFGLAGDRLYFRSEPRSAKVLRLRREPNVRVCPCNLRGKPAGPAVEGRARVLSGKQAERADAALSGNWTTGMKLLERSFDRMPLEMVYVEVEAVAPEEVSK